MKQSGSKIEVSKIVIECQFLNLTLNDAGFWKVFFSEKWSLSYQILARMRGLKNEWPFSALPRAYFYHPQLLKRNLVKAEI